VAAIGGARPLTSFGIGFADMVPARLLEQRAAADPDHGLVVIGDDVVTLREIDTATSRLGAALHDAGVKPGDRIGVMLPNGTAFLNVYFAAGKLGAVAVTINPSYQGYLLEYVLRDTDCALLFAGPDQLPAVDAALAATGATPTIVVVGAVPRPGALDYAEMLEAAPRACADSVSFTDINCVIYTSGTTGASKGVPISNAHAVAKAIEVVRICDVVADDVIYSPLPLFHSMALLRGVLVALVTGARCVLRERFSVSNYWDEVRRTGATVGHCVFTIPQLLQKAAPTDRDRDHTLRCLYNARYDAEFERRFGVRLIEGYGLTEAGVAMYMRADDPPRPGSCGRVSEDWEVQLLDADDVPVPTGEVGEIALRPKYPWLVTPGYLNKPDVTAATFRNLWFHTGDLARVDEEGYHYFADRKKDSIRRRGENVSSWELEQVLREHPAVEDAAAVPYPSPVGEDDVRVFVSPHPGTTVSGEEIAAHCARRLPAFMVPRYVEVLTALPRTPTGRVQKYELRGSALGPDHYDREAT
jgi:carnitine-CoA ligase